MLLKNDAVLGAEVKDTHRLNSVASETRRHFIRLDTSFGIDGLVSKSGTKAKAPHDFQAQLGKVYAAYSAFTEPWPGTICKRHSNRRPDGEELKKIDHALSPGRPQNMDGRVEKYQ